MAKTTQVAKITGSEYSYRIVKKDDLFIVQVCEHTLDKNGYPRESKKQYGCFTTMVRSLARVWELENDPALVFALRDWKEYRYEVNGGNASA